MIKIFIPRNNIQERTYAINECFSIIGIDFELNYTDNRNYILNVNGKELIIYDYFFSKHVNDRSYLKYENIPKDVIFTTNPFIVENDIPIIFGNNDVDFDSKHIECHIDIFASIFFMLTRWEEVVNTSRDNHLRYQAKNSLAFKYGFIERPVVNEYCEMLWRMLLHLGCSDVRIERRYTPIFTHDIDVFRLSICKSWYDVKNIISITYRSMSLSHIFHFVMGLLNYSNDAYNTFNFLMSKSERLGTKSHFYFMCDKDNRYIKTEAFKKTVKDIVSRGHIIGFHPDRMTCFNENQWSEEKRKVEKYVGMYLTECRQHILQIDIPRTFQIWENNGMLLDSTLGYADKSGYRCGTGDVFHLFDIFNSKSLQMKELPLVIMDGTLLRYEKLLLSESKRKIEYYITVSKKDKMPLTFLFHNSSFYGKEWVGWRELYSSMCEAE